MLEFCRIYIGHDQSEYKYKKGESRGYWTGRGWIIRRGTRLDSGRFYSIMNQFIINDAQTGLFVKMNRKITLTPSIMIN